MYIQLEHWRMSKPAKKIFRTSIIINVATYTKPQRRIDQTVFQRRNYFLNVPSSKIGVHVDTKNIANWSVFTTRTEMIRLILFYEL
jgi:hypothetical protein